MNEKIPLIYLRDLVALMDSLDKLDRASEFLFTMGPIDATDGQTTYPLVYEDDQRWLDYGNITVDESDPDPGEEAEEEDNAIHVQFGGTG